MGMGWVDTNGSVAVPDVHVDVWQRVTGVGVDHLDVHVQGDTGLGLDDVLADQLAGDIFVLLVGIAEDTRLITYSRDLG